MIKIQKPDEPIDDTLFFKIDSINFELSEQINAELGYLFLKYSKHNIRELLINLNLSKSDFKDSKYG